MSSVEGERDGGAGEGKGRCGVGEEKGRRWRRRGEGAAVVPARGKGRCGVVKGKGEKEGN